LTRKTPGEPTDEQRRFERRSLGVPFRMAPKDRPSDAIEGETLDVSEFGMAVKLGRSDVAARDSLLQRLVEDRDPVDVWLRLPEGSVSAHGQVTWWGLLGDEGEVAIRAGILLPRGWNAQDWTLIEKNLKLG
jgi:hypothetical protein